MVVGEVAESTDLLVIGEELDALMAHDFDRLRKTILLIVKGRLISGTVFASGKA